MAKITRATHKVFGAGGTTDQFAEFGSLVAGTPLKTKDIATIQALPAWNTGWQSAIFPGNKAPLLEDLNAFAFEHSTQLGYIFEMGIPEWDSGTTYYKGSAVQRTDGSGNGTGEIYVSQIDNNLGNALPVQASNANWRWYNPPAALVSAVATNAIPKISGSAPTVGAPSSQQLVASSILDDGTNVVLSEPLKFSDGSIQTKAAQPVTTQTVVTGSRAFNIVYRNNGTAPMFVAISLGLSGGGPQVFTDSNPSPTTMVAALSGSSGAPDEFQLFFIVLPGNYYKVASGGGSESIIVWTEWQ